MLHDDLLITFAMSLYVIIHNSHTYMKHIYRAHIKACMDYSTPFTCIPIYHMFAVSQEHIQSPRDINWARGYKTFFMLNSIEHEIFPAHKC